MRSALSFLTVFGRPRAPDGRALVWFPVVGLVVGAVVGGVWWGAARVWPAAVAGVLAVSADAVSTGLLHLDGLADAADGLLPPVERSRRFDIMADPHIGAFGMVALVLVLALRVTAFSVTRVDVLAIMGIWCCSRTVMAFAVRALPRAHAPSASMAASFDDSTEGARPGVPAAWWAVAGLTLAVASTVAGAGPRGAVVIGAELVAAAAILLFAWRKVGGTTGDVLGAAGVVAETVGLLVLAAK